MNYRSVEEILINSELVKHVISNYNESLIKTEPTIVKSSVKTSDFVKRMINSTSIYEILPQNCRFIQSLSNNTTMLIIEEQPKVRTILVDRDMTFEYEKLKRNGKFEEYNLKNFGPKLD